MSIGNNKIEFTQQDTNAPIRLNPTCLASCAKGLYDIEQGYHYIFPKIIIMGTNSTRKQKVLKILTGLSNTNLLFSRKLKLSFHCSNEKNDYVKVGGFGGNTYKLKNLNKRLAEENIECTDKPFKIELYSKNIKREYKLIILPDKCEKKITPSDIVIDVDKNLTIDFDKIATEQIEKGYVKEDTIKINHIKLIETYGFYCENILRFAERQDKKIFFNIINKESDEQIIYECSDFILVRDLLWDGNNINNMHCLTIFKDPNLMSIRDLTKSNIELLNTALIIGKSEISKLHNVSTIKIETYFHYHPSIWQLHMHFVSNNIEENHKKFMVDDIITNLTLDSDYYKKDIIL